MKRDDTVYLLHILDAIGLIEEYTKGMSQNEFLINSMAHDAVVRQIEIMEKPPGTSQTNFKRNILTYLG